MDRVVAARKLIGDLVKLDQIKVRRIEIVGRDLAKLLETLKQPLTGQELGEWLEEHPQISELSASTAVLDELIDRHFRDPDATATITEARNPDLERQVREDPESSSPYVVYADWLQERADPLGELIALSVASANGHDNDIGRFERHLKRHDTYFLGESAHEITSRVVLQWRFGFVQSIDALGDLDVVTWQRLLGLRVCELLESITLRRPCSAAVDAAIAAAAPATMRALTLESIEGSLPSHLLRRPLRSLSVRATPTPFAVARDTFPPTLERLDLYVFNVRALEPLELAVRDLSVLTMDANIAFLLETKFPRLERLALDLAHTAAAAVSVLENIHAPSLTHLTLRGGSLDHETLRCLAALPLATRLRSLGLVGLGLTDDTIGPIAATRGFSALEAVEVSHNELTGKGLELARSLAPTVTSTRQRRRGHHAEQRVRAFAGSVLQAAEQIADPKEWRRAGIDGDIRWGRYRGEADYELFIAADLSRYGCTCPSTIQPCEHVVALALISERTGLRAAPSNGIEIRVTTRAGLTDLLLASVDVET